MDYCGASVGRHTVSNLCANIQLVNLHTHGGSTFGCRSCQPRNLFFHFSSCPLVVASHLYSDTCNQMCCS